LRHLRLDDLYRMTAHIYGNQNEERSVSSTFSRLVEACAMNIPKRAPRSGADWAPESALCRAIGWYFVLIAKFRVASVEDLVFRKFPYVCPYCLSCPHKSGTCSPARGLDGELLRERYLSNKGRMPAHLGAWQEMFSEIYPRTNADRNRSRSLLGLFKELGELGEAVRVFDRFPRYFSGEAADVFSYIMGLAIEFQLTLGMGSTDFSFEHEYLLRYPGLCPDCGYHTCVCPPIPDTTVGRLAREVDLGAGEQLFMSDPHRFDRDAQFSAKSVLDSLGGYAAVVEAGSAASFPLDRGDANRALVMFCLEKAEEIETQAPELARILRSAAIRAGRSTVEPGSKSREPEALRVVQELSSDDRLRGVLGRQADEDASPVESQLARLILPHARVLLVMANPADTERLDLAREERAIREAIAASHYRDHVVVNTLPASTPLALNRELGRAQYDIVHFAGHGTSAGIVFETDTGSSQAVEVKALRDLLRLYPSVRCAILNACGVDAHLLIPLAPVTVVMDAPVSNKAAVVFAGGFYDGIGAGKAIKDAVQQGVAGVRLVGLEVDFPIRVLEQ
jgi:NTP pyrophosphatase (non-canonical NTP hydrolase)